MTLADFDRMTLVGKTTLSDRSDQTRANIEVEIREDAGSFYQLDRPNEMYRKATAEHVGYGEWIRCER